MAKKENNRKSGAALRHKQQLREEAEERQRKRDSRSPEQQLALLAGRPGSSAKEKARLEQAVERAENHQK